MPTASNGSAGAAERLRKVALPALAALPLPARRVVLHAFGRYAPWEDGFDFSAPALGEGEVVGSAGFRRHRRPEVGHHLVVRAHRRAPGRRLPRRHPQGAPLLRTLRHPPLRGGRRRDVPLVVPAPGGPDHGRVDARTTCTSPGFRRCWRSRRPTHDCSCSCATRWSASAPASPTTVATPGGSRQTSTPTRSCAACTAGGSNDGSSTFPATASSSCSTSSALPTRAAELERTYRFLGLPPFSPPAMLDPRQRIGRAGTARPRRTAAGWPTSTHRTSACCRRSCPTSTWTCGPRSPARGRREGPVGAVNGTVRRCRRPRLGTT